MASIVKIKRSSVQGKAPQVADLQSGELALNTRDGKLFSSDGSSIFEIGANTSSATINILTIGNTYPYTLPRVDGDAGQVLTTDGAGNITFQSPSTLGSDDALGYTNSTITNYTLFAESQVNLGDLSDGDVTDAFGVLIDGEILDCMEPIRETKITDFESLT